jgi:hypothetical protein
MLKLLSRDMRTLIKTLKCTCKIQLVNDNNTCKILVHINSPFWELFVKVFCQTSPRVGDEFLLTQQLIRLLTQIWHPSFFFKRKEFVDAFVPPVCVKSTRFLYKSDLKCFFCFEMKFKIT